MNLINDEFRLEHNDKDNTYNLWLQGGGNKFSKDGLVRLHQELGKEIAKNTTIEKSPILEHDRHLLYKVGQTLITNDNYEKVKPYLSFNIPPRALVKVLSVHDEYFVYNVLYIDSSGEHRFCISQKYLSTVPKYEIDDILYISKNHERFPGIKVKVVRYLTNFNIHTWKGKTITYIVKDVEEGTIINNLLYIRECDLSKTPEPKYKVGDELIKITTKDHNYLDFFNGKIVKVKEILKTTINGEEDFIYSVQCTYTNNNFWTDEDSLVTNEVCLIEPNVNSHFKKE